MNMPMGGMGSMPMNPMMQQEQGTNLLQIIINIAFGFVAGLVIFVGFDPVIHYGTKLANEVLKLSPQAQEMAAFGMASSYASYVVIVPLIGLVGKQLASVRSLKSFAYFLAAVIAGLVIAFVTKGYFTTLMGA